jgi:hypothetical protein
VAAIVGAGGGGYVVGRRSQDQNAYRTCIERARATPDSRSGVERELEDHAFENSYAKAVNVALRRCDESR